MSSPEEVDTLKAGHPPAVKVGGMRITQHKTVTHNERERHDSKEKPTDEVEEEETETKPSTTPPKQQILISGAPARGDADFPPQAVQATHVKPLPSHEYRSTPSKPNIIHQPRK